MKASARDLIFDTVIGLQMVEGTLDDEVTTCEKEAQQLYAPVLAGFRKGLKDSGGDNGELESYIDAQLRAIGLNDCPNELLQLEIAQELHDLQAALQQDLKQYEHEFCTATSATGASTPLEVAIPKSDGWSDSDEERFLKVLKTYQDHQAGTKSKRIDMLYDQLVTVLPHIPLKEIKKHVKFHQHLRFYQEKCRDRHREFMRRTEEYRQKAVERIQRANDAAKDRQCKVEELAALKQRCGTLRDKVQDWRAVKEAEARIEKQQQEIEATIQRQHQEEEDRKWKKKHENQKLAVEEFKWVACCYLLTSPLTTDPVFILLADEDGHSSK